jgi:Ca2+-binding EF-hand superfamily protein
VAFKRFDGDGDGRLSPGDLASGLASMGQPISLEEAQRIVQAVTRGSGQPFIK